VSVEAHVDEANSFWLTTRMDGSIITESMQATHTKHRDFEAYWVCESAPAKTRAGIYLGLRFPRSGLEGIQARQVFFGISGVSRASSENTAYIIVWGANKAVYKVS